LVQYCPYAPRGVYFDDTSLGVADGEFDPKKFKPITSIPDENLRALENYGRHLYRNTDYALLGPPRTIASTVASVITGCGAIICPCVSAELNRAAMTMSAVFIARNLRLTARKLNDHFWHNGKALRLSRELLELGKSLVMQWDG
jgi:hypothetical protein